MNARYNHIFNALVADEDDILGQLAYAAYKRQKIEFIQAFKDKNGTDPEDKVLFHSTTSATGLASWKTTAPKPQSL
ncbi:hypothetical protein [Pseudomonas sp. SLFW]|uniref:hypothetical protein n=1 Tax=Pseudomonas sp. SLFW TaxID=2683259 RepID=UPI002115986B|nr:hypothetical protein [Pseudomonas sp. SLFW]